MDWSVLVDGEQADGFSWLAGLLARGGLVLAMHQGKLTVRAVEDVRERTAYRTWAISSDDIVRGSEVEYEAYSSEVDTEYSDLDVRGDSAASTLPSGVYVDTLPGGDYLQYDLSDVVIGAGQIAQLDATRARLELGATQIPERVQVRVSLAYAGATVMDRVRLDMPEIYGRYGSLGDVDGVITAVSPDWSSGVVDITIHVWQAHAE